MFSTLLILPSLLLPALAEASPVRVIGKSPVTLPIARRLQLSGTSGTSETILQRDQARAAALIDRAAKNRNSFNNSNRRRAVVNEAVDNVANGYLASVAIGNPATTFSSLIIDTGSSNTWVGAGTRYTQTSTSIDTGNSVSVTYGSGSFSGEEFLDQVAITPDLVITNQSIGVASQQTGFDGVDGILGIGPVDLTQGTLSPDTDALIPTVTDNLFSQGLIDQDLIGISFNPTTELETLNGELTWGGVDDSKFTGDIAFTPITSTEPASFFWGIDESITYGSANLPILEETAGIVDTGTTLILLPTDAATLYTAATGATLDRTTGLLRITQAQFANLESLFFHVGDNTYELTPDAQTWPRALNTAIGGSNNFVYLIVADFGSPSGEGLDFINGYTFLERFYSVFDTTGQQVGFATTPNTDATTNQGTA